MNNDSPDQIMSEEDALERAHKIVSVMDGLSIENKLRVLEGVTYSIVLRQPNPDDWLEAFRIHLGKRWPEMKAMVDYLNPNHRIT